MWLTWNGRLKFISQTAIYSFSSPNRSVGWVIFITFKCHTRRSYDKIYAIPFAEGESVYELQKEMLRWLRSMTRLKWLFYFGNNWSMTNYHNARNERRINLADRFRPLLATKKKIQSTWRLDVLPRWSWMAANSGLKWKKMVLRMWEQDGARVQTLCWNFGLLICRSQAIGHISTVIVQRRRDPSRSHRVRDVRCWFRQ